MDVIKCLVALKRQAEALRREMVYYGMDYDEWFVIDHRTSEIIKFSDIALNLLAKVNTVLRFTLVQLEEQCQYQGTSNKLKFPGQKDTVNDI